MTFKKITIEATVNSDLQTTWDSYTQPEHITQWNFADDSWHCPWAENDLKVGGKMKSRMEAKDGSFGFDFEGIYDVVEDKQKLVYHLEDGRVVETTFADKGGSVLVTTTFDAETENPIEMQRGGWQMILNNYKKHTEQL
ncbi:MAG: SRPBCC domain-containing protein [Oceanospirillaceae bacterium]|nr:SRPBCC domain-containing protein [Oceanospirillaceae bacterium]